MNNISQAARSRNGILFIMILGSALLYVLYQLFVDFSLGGNSWKQGDWLINEISGPIRRGLLGSAILLFSDVVGLSPLLILISMQALFVTLIFTVVGVAALRLGIPDKLLLLLISPGFLILFWFNDPQGSVRKELLVYLAFLPLVVAALRNRGIPIAYVLSCIAYAMAVFAHEGTVFFLPFLWLAIFLVLPPNSSTQIRIAAMAVPSILAIVAGLYAAMNTHLPDTNQICAEVMQRGLDPAICDGAIDYLEHTPEEARMEPGRLLSAHFPSFVLIYAACLLSFRVVLQGSDRVGLWFIAVVSSGLAFLPLYVLAGDWGRWLNYHISSLTFVLLIFLLKRRPAWLYDAPQQMGYVCLLAVSLVVGVNHSPGEMIGGFLVNVALLIYNF